MTNLGVAMGSKFSYFAAGGTSEEIDTPLVYDQNAHWALANLTGAIRDAPDPRRYMTSTNYADVVNFIRQAAQRFDLHPDDAEYALFGAATWLRRRRWNETIRSR